MTTSEQFMMNGRGRTQGIFLTLLNVVFACFLIESIRATEFTYIFLAIFAVFLIVLGGETFNKATAAQFSGKVFFIAKFAVVVYAYVTARTFHVNYADISLDKANEFFFNIVVMGAIILYFRRYADVWRIADVIKWTCVVFSGVILVASAPSLLSMRLGAAMGFNANMLALFASTTVIWVYVEYKKNRSKSSAAILVLLALVVLLSGSRKGLAASFGGIVLFNLMTAKGGRKILKLATYSGILLGGYQLLMSVPFLYSAIGHRVENLVLQMTTGKINEGSMESRTVLIESAWSYIQDKPWCGYGLNTFRFIDHRNMYSHNNIVELLFSGGIFLTAIYYALYLWIIGRGLVLWNRNANKERLAIVLTINLIALITDLGMVSYYSRFTMIIQLWSVCVLEQEARWARKELL